MHILTLTTEAVRGIRILHLWGSLWHVKGLNQAANIPFNKNTEQLILLSKNFLCIICTVIINLWLNKEFNICNTAGLLIASRINMWVRHCWFCNWDQMLNFEHSPSPNGQLTSSIIPDDTAGYVWGCSTEKFVFIPVHVRNWIRSYSLAQM